MRSEGYGSWSVSLSVRPSVCYHVFCHYAQQGGQKAIPTGSVPHWLDLKNGDFRKSTAFKSYGVKTFSATTRNKAAKKRYQRVQCHTGLILKMAIFVKVLRSKVMA